MAKRASPVCRSRRRSFAVGHEGLRHPGRRRDRVPGAHSGPAIDGAQRRGAVAFDIDAIAHLVRAANLQADRRKVLARIPAPHGERVEIGLDQPRLGLELLADQGVGGVLVDAEQLGQGADIDDVLEQLALARIGVGRVAHGRQRHADQGDVVSHAVVRKGLGRVVEQIAARLDRGDVLAPGLGVHRHHQVDTATASQMPRFADPDLVPGRQALDVRGEDVARRHRHAHAQDRLAEQGIGAGRARSIDVGELDHEVVYRRQRRRSAARGGLVHYIRHAPSACVISSRNLRMSQAPVGQRSAHSPQCRQTSSSLTITRPVGNRSET